MSGMSSRELLLVDVVKELIQSLRRASRICIATHRNADPDAVASVLSMEYVVRQVNAEASVIKYFPEGLESVSKDVIRSLWGDEYLERMCSVKSPPVDCDLILILDTASRSQLGNDLSNIVGSSDYIIIDHHEVSDLIAGAKLSIHYPQASSTTELISKLMIAMEIKPGKELATLMIAGILYDTKLLKLIRQPETFEILSWLLRCGGSYGKVVEVMTKRKVPYSERVARLKALSRTGVYAVSDDSESILVAITCIGAFESSVLKLLQDAGADVAIALCKRKGTSRIVIRVSKHVIEKVGRPVAAELARVLGEELGGSGGGHAAAAGASVPTINPATVTRVLSNYFKKLGYRLKVLEEGRWVSECV